MFRDQPDQVAVAVGKAASLGGGTSASAYLFGLTANELAAWVGALMAIIGVCIQWYFGCKRDRRERDEEQRDIALHNHNMRDHDE